MSRARAFLLKNYSALHASLPPRIMSALERVIITIPGEGPTF